MAHVIRGQFGGLLPDLSATRWPAGTAVACKNVELNDGKLSKRKGFELEASLSSIKGIWPCNFSSASLLAIKDNSTLRLWSDQGGGTNIAAVTSMETDRGWLYFWADRAHYMNQDGARRIESDGTDYPDGISRPNAQPTITSAAGGEKEGYYHVWVAGYNSVTGEVGQVGLPGRAASTGFLETRYTSSTGGITITNEASTLVSGEADGFIVYCSRDTEALGASGSEVEVFTYRGYIDVVGDNSDYDWSSTFPGLNKADHALDLSESFTNAGGVPPASTCGFYTGSRAVYCGIYESSSLVPGKIMFSIPEFPTMVPQRVEYSTGGDAKTFIPRPYDGDLHGAFNGKVIDAAYGGGVGVAFTQNSCYIMRSNSRGQVRPAVVHGTIGIANEGACVGTPRGVFFVANNTFGLVTASGWTNLSLGLFHSKINAMIDKGDVYLGYYGARDQVWICAGDTILVYDLNAGQGGVAAPYEWTLEDCASDAITAVCEASLVGNTPKMYIGTTGGKLYSYPSTNAYDNAGDFEAYWTGLYGQELPDQLHILDRSVVYTGSNCASKVSARFDSLDSPGATATLNSFLLRSNDSWIPLQANIGRVAARAHQIGFHSSAEESTGNAVTWSIDDLLYRTNPQPQK